MVKLTGERRDGAITDCAELPDAEDGGMVRVSKGNGIVGLGLTGIMGRPFMSGRK